MRRHREILLTPLCLTLLGVVFCLWNVFGNDVSFCVTSGCSLYQDFTIGGISLWWGGVVAFSVLGLLSLVGASGLGRVFAGLVLFGDVCLLSLMILTAPCVSCLLVAIVFAVTYMSFRSADQASRTSSLTKTGDRSLLLWLWLLLFTANAGAVAKSNMAPWPILEPDGDVVANVYFSPSCPSCREAVTALSGRVDVAFYPVLDQDDDVHKVAAMIRLLNQGESIAEALAKAPESVRRTSMDAVDPKLLLLRFRGLRNKAHVFASGTSSIPFIEYRGLPAALAREGGVRSPSAAHAKDGGTRSPSPSPAPTPAPAATASPAAAPSPHPPAAAPPAPPATPAKETTAPKPGASQLPEELIQGGTCGGATPCPQTP
jgi:hypothetical protein